MINRNYQQYDYEALYKLNNQHYHNLHQLQQHDPLSNNNNNNNEYNSTYDKDSSDQNLYVPSSFGHTMQTQNQTSVTSTSCAAATPVIFLFVTLLVTTSATAMLCSAMMSDHWEHISWDRMVVEKMTRNSTHYVQWHLNGKVAGINVKYNGKKENLFLVPMNGGIWTLCIDISESDMRYLGRYGFPHTQNCINYLVEEHSNAKGDELWRTNGFPANYHPQRMQNLSISCALVCMIILGCAALLGAFGICKRQISAILITGVMYLLAALFALFTLMIIYVKRHQVRPIVDTDYEGTIEGLVAPKGVARIAHPLLVARIFTTSWSIDLGWGGVLLCCLTSGLWIILSKIMRYNPLSAMLS